MCDVGSKAPVYRGDEAAWGTITRAPQIASRFELRTVAESSRFSARLGASVETPGASMRLLFGLRTPSH